jgi:hypothetical protein
VRAPPSQSCVIEPTWPCDEASKVSAAHKSADGVLLGLVPSALLLPALALILVISAVKVCRHK